MKVVDIAAEEESWLISEYRTPSVWGCDECTSGQTVWRISVEIPTSIHVAGMAGQ